MSEAKYYKEYFEKSVVVNQNYLLANPIYDIERNKIVVEDIVASNVEYVLVPEKYLQDKEILEYDYRSDYAASLFSKNKEEYKDKRTDVKFIYVKNTLPLIQTHLRRI
ncbi:MAG: hypothetical protein ACK5KR_00705 [Breznakia sp.]